MPPHACSLILISTGAGEPVEDPRRLRAIEAALGQALAARGAAASSNGNRSSSIDDCRGRAGGSADDASLQVRHTFGWC